MRRLSRSIGAACALARPALLVPGALLTPSAVLAPWVLLGVVGCASRSDHTEVARFVFEHRATPGSVARFRAETSDPEVIRTARRELGLPVAGRALHINGPIARGDGGHNHAWSWHFVPGEWQLVELSMELCDGTPQMVENDVDYWVDQVGRFCPWGSFVADEESVEP